MGLNIDILDRNIKGQMRVVKYLEIVDNAVSKIFMKFDDPEVGRKLIGANRLQGSGQEE